MKHSLAIFDWNGTLMDDTFASVAGANATFRAGGLPEISTEQYRNTMDFPILHFYNRNGFDTDTYLANFNTYGAAFLDTYKATAKSAPLRRGAMELLDWLLDQNVTLMVLSNFVQHELEAQMVERHVHHKFKHICGNLAFNEQEHSRTTKLGRLERVMAENGYDAKDAFIIGDSLEEPAIAHHLGMDAISVTWGCFAPERLRLSTTNYMIDELAELPKILQR